VLGQRLISFLAMPSSIAILSEHKSTDDPLSTKVMGHILLVVKKPINSLVILYYGTSISMRAFKSASLWLIEEAQSFHIVMSTLVFVNIAKTGSFCDSSAAMELG